MPASEPQPAELEAQAEAQDEAREAYESPVGDIETDTAPAAETPGRRSRPPEPEMRETPMPEGGEDHGETGDHLAAPAEPAPSDEPGTQSDQSNGNGEDHHEEEAVELVGGADAMEEVQERMPRFRRQYKI